MKKKLAFIVHSHQKTKESAHYCEQGTSPASSILTMLGGELPSTLLWHGPKNLLLPGIVINLIYEQR